ncbi:PIG-L deacetylase family protein [Rhodohalobacter sp.]|uniref:PIG-L deacetylase family protein n=1 Tax=Rhodohalobacter sp. TaxID=1974210 RepID=UPI0035638737
MKILYIFPHPDDESFGPAPAISAQLRQGHEVHLLTLTKGEATKQRFRLGVDKDEMGDIRFKEMQCVEKTLGLNGMTVLDLPDNELKKMNPIELENVIEQQIHDLKPDVIVTYAVHGISGFEDHLVCHAVVKRVYCKLRDMGISYPKRLALFTRMGEIYTDGKFRLAVSQEEDIKFIEQCNDDDMQKFNDALDCYQTYKEVIDGSGVRNVTTKDVPFEIFGENIERRLNSIVDGLRS